MPELKHIKVYTKVLRKSDNTGTATTFYNDDASEILASDVLGIDTSEELLNFNYLNVQNGDGILTIDEEKVPDDLRIVIDNGRLVVIGDNADKYSVDQDTGHLIFTEP